MLRIHFFILSFLVGWMATLFSYGQTSTLPIKGWAKNSVNSVIFRRNSAVTHNGYQYVAFYNGDGFVVLGKRKIGTVTWETKVSTYKGNVADAHNSISIMVDGSGFLHLSWDHHNTALNYCKSSAAESLTLAAKSTMIGSLETVVSYPEFHRLPYGDLLFMYRDGSSGNGNLVINQYSIASKTWKRLHNSLISGENIRNAYWQTFIDKKGTVHLSWVWRETSDVASNHDLCYARSTDQGKTWKKTNGSTYTIPINATTAEYALRIPQNSELINQTSMFGDTLGNPYICSYWTPTGSTIPQYHVVYHNGTQWKTVQASNRKTAFSLSGSGTKKIPISRPQLIIDNNQGTNRAYIVYRDVEQADKVSLSYTQDLASSKWTNVNLTSYDVGSWEPSFDTELWKSHKLLNIFVQKVGQGDGESLENLDPQNVTILEWNPKSLVTDLQEETVQNELALVKGFPNPFTEDITLQVPETFTFSVYDEKGILTDKGTGNSQIEWGRGFEKGLYLIKIQKEDQVQWVKVIKL